MTRKQPRVSKESQRGRCASAAADKTDATCRKQSPRGAQPKPAPKPVVVDEAEIASIDSFPCSDPPGYNTTHC